MKPVFTIRPATVHDITKVLSIAAEHDLQIKSPERVRNEGFLVSAYSREFYMKHLRRLTAACAGDEVAAFTLTFMFDELPPEVKDGPRVQSVIGNRPYMMIKQVGTSLQWQRSGAGRALYRHHLSTIDIPVFAPIVTATKNVNVTSIAFHESLNFHRVETFKDELGDEISGLWCWQPSGK